MSTLINLNLSKSKWLEMKCKSRLLFAKIAMAIWFQVSGNIFSNNGLSRLAPCAIYAFNFVTDIADHHFFIDLEIFHVQIISIGHLVSPLTMKPEA